MKKKILAAIVTAALSVTMLVGCGANGGAAKDNYKVGVCQLIQHEALDAATEGFMDALKELGGEDKFTFDVQIAGGESATCATIANGFVADGVDLIMANATPALQAASAATTDIPILGTSVTDYATALDIADWTGKTGYNVSGTSDCAPLEVQAEMIKEIFPDATNIGLVYCSAEPNSKYQADVVKAKLVELGCTVNEYTFADTNDLQSVTQTACDASEVIYIPTDNAAAAATETIDAVALAAGTPIVTGEEGICRGCGVATLSISYYDLGYVTGKMAYEILVNGKDVKDMDVQYAESTTKKFYTPRADQLGLTMPEGYEAFAD